MIWESAPRSTNSLGVFENARWTIPEIAGVENEIGGVVGGFVIKLEYEREVAGIFETIFLGCGFWGIRWAKGCLFYYETGLGSGNDTGPVVGHIRVWSGQDSAGGDQYQRSGSVNG